MLSNDPNEITWENLLSCWNHHAESLGSLLLTPLHFTEVKVRSVFQNIYSGSPCIDWWPLSEVEDRRKFFEDGKSNSTYLGTPKGFLTTADLLWKFKEDKEGIVAVWLAAALWNAGRNLPENLRGETAIRIDRIEGVLYQKIGLSPWHHNSHALPVSIIHEYLHPKSLSDLVSICVIEATLNRATYSLVKGEWEGS